MGLDASTLEWIRRLPDALDSRDEAALRVLRRTASEPGDVRLLDSVLASVNEDERARQEQAALQRRLAYLESQQTRDGRARLEREREQAIQRCAKSLVENERLSFYDAQHRSQDTLGQVWAEQDRRVAEETQALRTRLAGQPRD